MKCPECKSTNTHTIDSRPTFGGAVTRRRKRCKACKTKFTTYEAIEIKPSGKALILDRLLKINREISDIKKLMYQDLTDMF